MQSKDDFNNVKQLVQIDLNDLPDLSAKIKTAEDKGATSHAIGKLPKQGSDVEIGGLSYRVEFADFVKGRFTLKLTCRDR
jgi:Mg2+/Co2+ transporter CorC